MRWTWVQEFGQERDHCQLGNGEREDARAEGCYGVLDHVLLLLDTEGAEVLAAA
jgi:hypothetical protein